MSYELIKNRSVDKIVSINSNNELEAKDVSGSGDVVLSNNSNLTGTTDVEDISVSGTLTLSADPTLALEAATKQYVDAVASGLDLKASVRVATSANITLSGLQTIDDVSLSSNDRVLVKNQTNAEENGIYIASSGSWTRALDADNSPNGEVTSGMFTFVEEGTVSGGSGWALSTANPIVLDTTELAFIQFSSAGGSYTGSNLGTGAGVFKQLAGSDFQFRRVNAGSSKLSINENTNDITFDVVEANLTLSNLSGSLSAVKGGTGITSYTTGDIIFASSSTVLSKLGIGSSNQFLVSNGSTPVWTTIFTLTTGYIPLADSPNTLVNSLIYQSGSAVGIGLTDPNANSSLHVINNGTSGTYFERNVDSAAGSYIYLYKTRGTHASKSDAQNSDILGIYGAIAHSNGLFQTGEIHFTVDGTFTSGQRPPSRISFWTSTANAALSERMRITGAGRILMGTTSDNGRNVQISGNLSISNANSTTAILVSGTTSGTLNIGSTTGAIDRLTLLTASASAHCSIRMGRTTDDLWLSISGGSNQFSTIDVQSDVSLVALPLNLILAVKNDTGDIKFATGSTSTEKARITNSGNVLIGTTTDDGTNKLQVDGRVSLLSTLTVSGNVGIGASQNSAIGLNLSQTVFSGAATSQYGQIIDITSNSGATNLTIALQLRAKTAVASYTTTNLIGVQILDAVKGSGSSITTQYGLKIEDQSQGTTNYAIHTGSGLVHFGGSVTIASTLAVTGHQTNSGDLIFTLTDSIIRTNTIDGSDNKRIMISGGGNPGSTRGATVYVHGNEHSSEAGKLYLLAGNVAGGSVIMQTGGSTRYEINNSGVHSITGVINASSRLNVGGASDVSGWALNVAGGALGVSGTNAIISQGVGNPGDANYERISMVHTGTAAELRSQAGGTGTLRDLKLVLGSTALYTLTAGSGAHTFFIADNSGSIFKIQENANQYLNISTNNGNESIAFGNTTTNPSYLFLGSGSFKTGGKIEFTGTDPNITTDTSDGSDNKYIGIGGGGSFGIARGACLSVYGNEHGTYPGHAYLSGGSVATSAIYFSTNGSSRAHFNASGEFFTYGNAVIGASNTLKSTRLEIIGGTGATGGLLLSTSNNNSTNKEARIKSAHYTNAEEPVTLTWLSSQSSASDLYIGGNSSAENSVTSIGFYTAANNTTTSGTRRGGFDSNGTFDFTSIVKFSAVNFSDANYTIPTPGSGSGSYTYIRQTGTMSASRTVTLPPANSFPVGTMVIITDESGTVTGSNTIVITRAGSDTINGGTTTTINSAYGSRTLMSDGSSKWTIVGSV